MQSSVSWQSSPSVLDLWDVEWTAFLPSWGRSAVPHFKWDASSDISWNQVASQQKQQWNSWEENKLKWEGQSSTWWSQKKACSESLWNRGMLVQDKGGVRGATGWELHRAACSSMHPNERSPSVSPVGVASNSGALPSVGSAGHDQGLCKRCAFFPKGRCKNGADCTHCHLEHPKQIRHRRRAQNRGNRSVRGESQFEPGTMDPVDADSADEFIDDVAEETGDECVASPDECLTNS